MDELVTAAGLGADDGALIDEVNADAELVECRPIFDVPVEPVGLLYENDADPIAVLLEVRQQLRETGAIGGFGGFNVNEFFRDDDIVAGRIRGEGVAIPGC